MTKGRGDYQVYLLRLWRPTDAPDAPWRAMLEDIHTGERHGFAELEGLFLFLRQSAPLRPKNSDSDPGEWIMA